MGSPFRTTQVVINMIVCSTSDGAVIFYAVERRTLVFHATTDDEKRQETTMNPGVSVIIRLTLCRYFP